MEVVLDETHFPSVVGGPQVFEVISTIDIDYVELAVLAGIALSREPLV